MRAEQGTNGDRGAQEVLHEDEEAVDLSSGTSHQCLYRSPQLYEGCSGRQAQREDVLAELQEERARLRCMLIHLAKDI